MSKSFRRFEILLPLRFNDGHPVPSERIAETLDELQQRFGAVSCESQTIRGIWQYKTEVYRDESVRVFVDVADTPESSDFFRDFKERLKTRFGQIDIWIATYPVEIF